MRAPADPGGESGASPPSAGRVTAADLAADLARAFRDHVRRSLGFELDGSEASLAFVDHYLASARDEQRPPIVALLGAEAGAYYGELVRHKVGGHWIGEGDDPRRLRLLVAPQFVHFSPVDQAIEVVLGAEVDEDDPRVPDALDTAFHLRPIRSGDSAQPFAGEPDAAWVERRLAEMSPVPEQEYYSLTCRFETLEYIVELLAAKHAADGKSPREYGPKDYLEVLGSGD
jgi:hypothetical protein